MERAIHPELAKRWVQTDDDGRSELDHMGTAELIQSTRGGGGSETPQELRRSDVEILDVYRGMASVKVTSARYVDYIHVAQWNGQWKILNILWDFRLETVGTAGNPLFPRTAERQADYGVEGGSNARFSVPIREA